MSPISFVLLVLPVVAWIDASLAFAPLPQSPGFCKSSSSARHLVPEQGRQLVAYSQAALAKKAKESASKASNLTSDRRRGESSEGGLAKARNAMTRLLHLSPNNAGAEGEEDLFDRERSLHDQLSSFYGDLSDEVIADEESFAN